MSRFNIVDLAKALSLNPSTISRALSGHKDISEATRKRVMEAAEEFNYIPNLHAKYFRKKNSGLIALVLPEFNMFFTHSIMDGINEVLNRNNLTLIVFFTNNSLEREKEIINHCLSWVVEGVLMVISDETDNLDHLNRLHRSDIPIVLFDKVIQTELYSTVTIDDVKTAYNGTKILLDEGKKNLIGIFARPNLEISQYRAQGFKKAVNEVEGSRFECVFVNDAKKLEENFVGIDFSKFDGAFVMSDELLINLYGYLRRVDLYPQKISIAAISDGVLPDNLSPFVPYIKHSGAEIGAKASELLVSIIKSGKMNSVQHLQAETSKVVF
jgi:LacI family transcriptional regulator